jgi:hypothetical protein
VGRDGIALAAMTRPPRWTASMIAMSAFRLREADTRGKA